MTVSRRVLLLGLAAVGIAIAGRAAAGGAVIRMKSAPDGSDVWFDPVGLWVPVGTTVTWVNDADQTNTHTTTAYHPSNGNHSLRIPDAARPWDSGYLLPGMTFAVTFDVAGVYDYFCQPHEMAGMVGRIVVGTPNVGARSFAWPVPGHPEWTAVAPEAQRAFPSVADILQRKAVRR